MAMIKCAGCGIEHESYHSKYMKDPRTGKDAWFCRKWFAGGLSQEEKMRGMSPADIMSGVHLGMDRQDCYGSNNNQEDHSVLRARQMKEFTKAIDH